MKFRELSFCVIQTKQPYFKKCITPVQIFANPRNQEFYSTQVI